MKSTQRTHLRVDKEVGESILTSIGSGGSQKGGGSEEM